MVSTWKISLIFRFIDKFGFTCSFNFAMVQRGMELWDKIDNGKVNSEIVNSINGFRVTNSNNSGNDISSGSDIHNDSENYDSSHDEWSQKQYRW